MTNLAEAIDNFLATVPSTVDPGSDVFNDAVATIQNVLGQGDGGPASMFFDDAWLEEWRGAHDEYRKELILKYVRFELSYLEIE